MTPQPQPRVFLPRRHFTPGHPGTPTRVGIPTGGCPGNRVPDRSTYQVQVPGCRAQAYLSVNYPGTRVPGCYY
eukprot:916290-Rhodomonas_salina.1